MALTKDDYLMMLAKAYDDPEAYRKLEAFIRKHFDMVEHMKTTSLWDVYEYENKLTKFTLEPMKTLVFENDRLKKEVNKLRKQLGMIEKYKE